MQGLSSKTTLEGSLQFVFIRIKLISVFCRVLAYDVQCTQCLAVSAAQHDLNKPLKTRGGGRRSREVAV